LPASIPTWASRGLQELVRRKGRSGGLQAEAGEGIEHDLGKAVEVPDQEGEETDIKRLLDEMSDHIFVRAPGPEEARKSHVDDDQRRGEKRDLAAKQTKARVDVAREDLGEAVDDAGVHFGCPAVSPGGRSAPELCVEGHWGALRGKSLPNGTAGSFKSGVAGTTSVTRSWSSFLDSKTRLRLASQTALQTASFAALAPIALQCASSASSAPGVVEGSVFEAAGVGYWRLFNAIAARSAPASAT
jgi:hypothetical protein